MVDNNASSVLCYLCGRTHTGTLLLFSRLMLAPRALAMSTAPNIVQLPYTYWTERASAPIVAIIAHNTVGTDSRKYLSQGGPRKVSIHALIPKDGTLYRYVPDERGANHAGYGVMPPGFPRINPNRCTIGFELENASDGKGRADPYPAPQLLTMGWEINRIRAKFGHLPILRHETIDPKRRLDTVGLTIGEMEAWAAKAAAHYAPLPSDPFSAWGPIGKPEGLSVSFAIPRAWLVNQKLGACVHPETYSASGRYSVTEFERGIVTFLRQRNTTIVEMFDR